MTLEAGTVQVLALPVVATLVDADVLLAVFVIGTTLLTFVALVVPVPVFAPGAIALVPLAALWVAAVVAAGAGVNDALATTVARLVRTT
jgi:hypothetical protein